jgi:hypothetical protein
MARVAEEHDVPARVALFFGWTRSPVWYRTPGDVGDVDLTSLPLSDGLRQRLQVWNAFADRTLSSHGFEWPDAQTEADFAAAGSALAQELRDELGIEVIYTPDGDVDTPVPQPPQQMNDRDHYGWQAFTPLSGETFPPSRPPE